MLPFWNIHANTHTDTYVHLSSHTKQAKHTTCTHHLLWYFLQWFCGSELTRRLLICQVRDNTFMLDCKVLHAITHGEVSLNFALVQSALFLRLTGLPFKRTIHFLIKYIRGRIHSQNVFLQISWLCHNEHFVHWKQKLL